LFAVDTSGSMRGEPINALKTAMINTIQYINDDNYIGILDELLGILNDK
jgi:Ca-activated chloride channel family protein